MGVETDLDAGASLESADAAFIPLCVPEIRGNEWLYVKECLDTTWVSSGGPFVDRFEVAFADWLGRRAAGVAAVACQSGTAALHAALMVAGVGPGDAVLVSCMTFIAPANAVRYVGAEPVLVDAEPDHWQMDVGLVARYLAEDCVVRDGATVDARTGRRVAALMPVHILGHPVDMDPLLELARAHGLAVIEDATESLGALYKGRPVGTLGDIAAFSFNGNKLMTTGSGGMIVTRNPDWARRAKHLTNQAKVDPIEYAHDEVGYNYRLTNIQAGMGLAQLENLPDFLAAKRRIAARYAEGLDRIPGLEPMRAASWADSAWWMYTIRVDADAYGMDSRALLRALDARRIQTRPLWRALHQGPPHAGCPTLGGAVAERLHATALSLPCSVGLGEATQERVLDTLAALRAGTRTQR